MVWYIFSYRLIKLSGNREKSEWHLPKKNLSEDKEAENLFEDKEVKK